MRFSPKKLAPMFLLSLFVAGVAYAGTYYYPSYDSTPTDWTLFASSTSHSDAVDDDIDRSGNCGIGTSNNTYIYTSTSGTLDVLGIAALSGNTITVTPCVKERAYLSATSKLRVRFSSIDGAQGQSSASVSEEKVFTIPSSTTPDWVSLSPQVFSYSFNISNHATSSFKIHLKHEGSGLTKLTNIESFIE